tara:strand:+ start:1195 stop:1839 length:645 start_codon:yes stop_codon:yes gene_type:complete
MSEIRTEKIIGETGVDAVNFTKGLNATGVSTATNISVGSSITAGTFFGDGTNLTNVTAGLVLRKTAYTIARQTITRRTFPADNSIPQRDEGTEFFSQAYTPSTANCDLYITAHAALKETSNNANDMAYALFINDSDDALRVVSDYAYGAWNNNHGSYMTLVHKMPSWGASAKTFSLRAAFANSINYQSRYNSYAVAAYSQAASETLFIVEEVST